MTERYSTTASQKSSFKLWYLPVCIERTFKWVELMLIRQRRISMYKHQHLYMQAPQFYLLTLCTFC